MDRNSNKKSQYNDLLQERAVLREKKTLKQLLVINALRRDKLYCILEKVSDVEMEAHDKDTFRFNMLTRFVSHK